MAITWSKESNTKATSTGSTTDTSFQLESGQSFLVKNSSAANILTVAEDTGILTSSGGIKIGGNVIYASDGGSTITLDTSDNVTITGDLTVSGGDVNGGRINMTVGETTTVIGEGAGVSLNPHSRRNTFMGYGAGAYSVAFAGGGGASAIPSGDNTYIGYQAGMGPDSYPYSVGAWGNTAIGSGAFESCGGDDTQNTAVGISSLKAGNDVSHDTAIGASSLYSCTSGGNNTCVGSSSGYYITTGAQNTHLGKSAGYGATGGVTGNSNTTVGYQAGFKIQGASAYNTFVGSQVGDNITTGTNNTMIGFHISASAVDVTHEIVIGSGESGTSDFDGAGTDTIRIGRADEYMTGDLTSNTWSHGSDIRIKKDISDNELGLDFINDLRTVNYKKKAPSEYPKEFKAYNTNETERKNPDRVYYGLLLKR